MFEGFSSDTIDFMIGICFNNNRTWFEEHKQNYKDNFLTPMKELAQDVYESLQKNNGGSDLQYKVSRIYKDARRLHGGEPYRDHLWFTIEKPSQEWTCKPVFWFELGPENWSYGLGYYQAKPSTMAKFRARLENEPKKFEVLIEPLQKQREFVLDGEEYKRKKVAPSPKTEMWYNKKSFSLVHNQKNGKELFEPKLVDYLVNGYETLMPLFNYLESLDNDPEPKVLDKK